MKKKLYVKDDKGNILVWGIKIEDKHSSCTLIMNRGRFGGAQSLTFENDIVPKNVGKSNENTAYEQAMSRFNSRMNKKLKAGYIDLSEEESRNLSLMSTEEDQENYLKNVIPDSRTDAEGFVKPMKASQYFKSKPNWIDPTGKLWKNRKYFYLENPHAPKEKGYSSVVFPSIIQPKINGVRATIFLDEEGKCIIKSKEGLRYSNLSHIENFINTNCYLFGEEGDYVLDGELYIHNELLQDIGSAVKKVNFNTPRVRFVIFDIANESLTNLDRIKILHKKIKPLVPLDSPVEILRSITVNSDEQVQNYTDEFIKQGYEGSIIRNPDSEYQFGKRRINMLKLKRLISFDFRIISIIPQQKQPKLGMYLCRHKGKEFTINPTKSDSFKEKLLLNRSQYIGLKVQTDFYEWTKEEKPFHIVNTVIRNYE